MSETGWEPYCNHDPAAVRDGICECGAVMPEPDECSNCGQYATTEINAEPLCDGCAGEFTDQGNADALDRIAAILRAASDWDADTINAVADAVRATGRTVSDDDAEPDDIKCGHQDLTGKDG
jgi:hypothetical protein